MTDGDSIKRQIPILARKNAMGTASIKGAFNQEQIAILEKAMVRAWEVIAYFDDIPDTPGQRKLLASCIVDAALTGEVNHMKLVNDAIFRFRLIKGAAGKRGPIGNGRGGEV